MDQLEGAKIWRRASRSRNIVSAADAEASDQEHTYCEPSSLEWALDVAVIAHSAAPASLTVASDTPPLALAARISSKEFARASKAFLRPWHRSSQPPATGAGTAFGGGPGGRLTR